MCDASTNHKNKVHKLDGSISVPANSQDLQISSESLENLGPGGSTILYLSMFFLVLVGPKVHPKTDLSLAAPELKAHAGCEAKVQWLASRCSGQSVISGSGMGEAMWIYSDMCIYIYIS